MYFLIHTQLANSPLQDIVTRYRQSMPEDFWKEFSVNGCAMKFTRIVDRLCRQHSISNDNVVACAHEEYGDAFNSLFSYCKGDEVHAMRNKSAIACQYQQLKKQ
jgi:phosphatidylinositol kinase/protein kinase (PI-3  family)